MGNVGYNPLIVYICGYYAYIKRIYRHKIDLCGLYIRGQSLMIDCQNLTFSSELSQRRINQFKTILGEQIINKIIFLPYSYLVLIEKQSQKQLTPLEVLSDQ